MTTRKDDLVKISKIRLIYESKVKISNSPQIKTSTDGYNVFRANWSDEISLREEFNVLFLNRANRVIGLFNVSKGGISGTVVDIRLIFGAAITSMASAMILAHNHPSTNLRPSANDKSITEKFVKAGKLLDIAVLDHLILSPEGGYYSFADDCNL